MGELVRPLDTARHRAGQLTIADAHADLVAQVGEGVTPADHRWAHVYADRVLRADDRAGREQGRITRGDEVRWADVIALGKAAKGLLDPEHTGQDVTGCGACDLWRAVARVREAAAQAGAPAHLRNWPAADLSVRP